MRIEEELLFKQGHINLIVGPTGSGKTSMLMALLGKYILRGNSVHTVKLSSRRIALHPY